MKFLRMSKIREIRVIRGEKNSIILTVLMQFKLNEIQFLVNLRPINFEII